MNFFHKPDKKCINDNVNHNTKPMLKSSKLKPKPPPRNNKDKKNNNNKRKNGSFSISSCGTSNNNNTQNYFRIKPVPPKSQSFQQKAQNLEKRLNIKNRKYNFKTYKNCFIGSEAIELMIKLKYVSNNQDGVELGQQLMDADIIKHVLNKHKFKNEYLFYQFTSNFYKYFKTQSPDPPIMKKKPNQFIHHNNNNNNTRNASHSLPNITINKKPLLDMRILPQKQRKISKKSNANKSNSSASSSTSTPPLRGRKSRVGSSFSFVSKSTSNSSIGLSAHSLVSISNSALSLLDYGIDRKELEAACATLMDLIFDIRAIWIVARPINRAALKRHKFEHWCIKIHAHPALISMDFFEQNGQGAFGISSVCASWTELEDFLHYYITVKVDDNNNRLIKKAWKILSSVVPYKYNKITNLETHLLPLEIGKNTMINTCDKQIHSNSIKCDYKVRDIAEYIEEWSDNNKVYNTVGTNCQRFAYDLYKWLIGDYYPHKVKLLDQHLQSPYDRQKEKLNRLKQNQNPNLKHVNVNNDDNKINDNQDNDINDNDNDNDNDKNDDNNCKIQFVNTNKNNPETNVLVESLSNENDFITTIDDPDNSDVEDID